MPVANHELGNVDCPVADWQSLIVIVMNILKNLVIAAVMLLCCVPAIGQVNLFSKVEDVNDINGKTLMVVLENNSLTDLALKEAVEKNWDLSGYEFITPERFDEIKGDASYYFLTRVKGVFKKEREPGIEFIALYKGGPAGVEAVALMYEVLSIPFQALDSGDDNTAYLPAYINTIKNHLLRLQRKKIAARVGLAWYSNRMSDIKKGTILINSDDIASNLNMDDVKTTLHEDRAQLTDRDEIEAALNEKRKDTYVTLSIAPAVPQKGSYCYRLIVGTQSGEIFYYRKQKITQSQPKGFTNDDIKKISIYFN